MTHSGTDLWLRVRAILSFLKRHPVGASYAVLTLFMGWYIVWAVMNPPPPEIPTQSQARLATQQAAETARKKILCDLQSVCTKFGAARQECATAGDYKNCLTIKMGSDAMDLYRCMNDGRVWNEPSDIPNRFECLRLKIP